MRYEIETTLIFDKWLSRQKDRQAVKAIAMRIARAEEGNLGDVESVGGGVSEMRIFIEGVSYLFCNTRYDGGAFAEWRY